MAAPAPPTAAPATAVHAFQPYVAPAVSMRELTLRGVVVGSILGVVFAASSVYLGLKVVLTVSASTSLITSCRLRTS